MSYHINPTDNHSKVGMKYGQKEPVKLYFTPSEVSKLTGLTLGLCYYYRGQVGGERIPGKFSAKQVKEIQKLLKLS